MPQLQDVLGTDALAFIVKATAEAELAFRVFRETGTTTASATVGFIESIPGEDKLVALCCGGPFNLGRALQPAVFGLDGTVYAGDPRGSGSARYNKVFEQHPDITTVSHVHTPYLGAWAQTHRTLPIRYAPTQRYSLARELPNYVDCRQPEQEFILERLRIDAQTSAILEANGGATVWGRQGLRATAELILILEEGARLQLLSEAVGGSRDFGPGVVARHFELSGLTEQSRALSFLPAIPN